MIRVLVVDDSPSIRLGIRLVLESDPQLKVIGEARNGEESVDLCKKLHPDIVTMDIMMPGMGGYEAIGRIMSEAPCPILVLTGIESKSMVEVGFKALALGALSVLPKAALFSPDSYEGRELISQIKLMAGIKVVRRKFSPDEEDHKTVKGPAVVKSPPHHAFFPRMKKEARLVAIGASTGGPPALQVILSGLPPDFPLPIVVVQHISVGFSAGLASWLSNVTSLKCKLGESGEITRPGTVYFAPDGNHMRVNSTGSLSLDPSGPVGGHLPAINVLFDSVARNYGGAAIGILLTGMGKDGSQGLNVMHQAGAYAIAQNEKSSVVFSMPAAAIALDAVDEVLDLSLIAPWLTRLTDNK